MSKMSKLIIGLALLMLTTMLRAQSIEVTASVDKNPVMVDESFILSVVANGEVDKGAFDSSFLMKDFVVGRTSISSQTKMVNFDTTRTTSWSTILIPKNKGRFTIPSFDIDGSLTKPIEVLVIPVSANTSSNGRDLYITTDVDVEQAYLQQQIRYTVKLHLGKDLQRGSLSSPTLENADIRQIGKDKEYNDVVDGRRYRIIERSFAIIAQQSGTFTIEGPLFEGEVADNSRQSFGFFNRSKAVNRVGPSQSITVLPIPSNYDQHWLPSDFVQLDDEWQGNTHEYIAGEPITRTITLTAIGVVEEQLPQITSTYPDSVKTYPDQAETTTVEKDENLIAQRKESIAIIPSQAGELVIPEVRIPWFNTITKKTEYAVLAEKTLNILPATTQPSSAIPLSPSIQAAPEIKPQQPMPSDVNNQSMSVPQYWIWLTASLLLLWIITLLLWWKHVSLLKSASKKTNNSLVRNTQSEQELWKSLEKALNKNTALDTQRYLHLWLGSYIQDKNAPLEQSLKIIDDQQLSEAVNNLLACRYSKNQSEWQSKDLHQILRKLRKNGTIQKQIKHNLSPLYPSA
ncbi:BatD protein [Paraglaciecola arctica BSs20135]|uniref:BatD protein n=2 Tax=Paraglaciecola TaxID=1621534 RepID=K6YL51_9ALTE|nr:BatD protein [Paraglaciecola arctica BSs20135]